LLVTAKFPFAPFTGKKRDDENNPRRGRNPGGKLRSQRIDEGR